MSKIEMIPLFKVHVAPEAVTNVSKVLESGTLTQGDRVKELEAKLRDFLGAPRIATVNSATSGLTLALHLLKEARGDWPGLSSGDEVLTPALTCTATTWPIVHNGLQPKWLDVAKGTCNVSLSDIERKLTPKTKVVQVMHWGGTPVDVEELDRVLEKARKETLGFKPYVIEDCAHAFGALYPGSGRPVGSSSNICVFSFQAIKLLTTGDGGCLTLPDDELLRRCLLLRWYGIDREKRSGGSGGGDFRLENDVPEAGYKYHMNDYCAALGIANIDHVPRLLAMNRNNASTLQDRLSGQRGLSFANYGPGSSFWLFTVLVPHRDAFVSFMGKQGVMVSQVHRRNDVHSCMEKWAVDLPDLDELEKMMVSIPVGWWLTNDEVNKIASSVREFCDAYS